MPGVSFGKSLAFLALPVLLLPACSTAGKDLTRKAPIESRKSPAADEVEKMLSGFREAMKRSPGEKKLGARDIRTIEELKLAADRAAGRRDYDQAGRIYRLLLDNYADFGTAAPKMTFKKIHLESSLKICRAAQVEGQVRLALKTRDYAKALGIRQAALSEIPGDRDIAAKYMATAYDIKAVGDKSFAAKDFAQAGRVNVALLKYFASLDRLYPSAAFSKESLAKDVADCRESLTKTGLEEYRKGRLAEAIAAWEGLLSFDPDNAEIRKAVATAKTQLDGIKKQEIGRSRDHPGRQIVPFSW